MAPPVRQAFQVLLAPPPQADMEAKPLQVLLIADNPADALLTRELLAQAGTKGFELEWVERLATGIERLARGKTDAVLLDLALLDGSGLGPFRQVRARAAGAPIILLTDRDDEDLAAAAVREGAEDYLVKATGTGAQLARVLRYAVERSRRRQAEARVRAAEEEMRLAREIQQRLFPAVAPALPGFDIGGASAPAVATGGDYFDYVLLADESLGVVVGDVSGHGFGPALLMASIRAYVRALSLTCEDVGEILGLLNLALYGDTMTEHFATLILVRLDLNARTLVYANAGHPRGYLLDAAGEIKHVLDSTGLLLGFEPDHSYAASAVVPLQPGDLLFLMTDGILEALSPASMPFGLERALDVVRAHRDRSAEEVVGALYGAVRTFCGIRPQLDDMTAVVIKVLTPA